MSDATRPRWAQSPDDAQGAGGAGATETKTVDAAANATQTGGAASAAATKTDGGPPAKQLSMLAAPGAVPGDVPKDGKDTTKGSGQDAAAGESPAPVKVTLPEHLPDGVSVDQDFVKGAEAKFAELGITSEEGSALVAWYVEQEGQRLAKSAQALKQMAREQFDQLSNDPEFGGKNLAESQACVQKAINRFGRSTGLVERLESLGLGTDPVIIKTLAAIGKAISEDRSSVDRAGPDSKPANKAEATAKALFPSHDKLRKQYQE